MSTLCNPMDCSPRGSCVHGNLQVRILEWVAIPFSRESSQPRDKTWVSCIAGRLFTLWATSLVHRSVQFSHSVMSNSLRPHESQHAGPPCPSPTPRAYSNPCPSSRWCHPAISSSVVPFSCPQPLPTSGSFPMSESALRMRWPKYWSFSFSIEPPGKHKKKTLRNCSKQSDNKGE